jgi:hypothetical protein
MTQSGPEHGGVPLLCEPPRPILWTWWAIAEALTSIGRLVEASTVIDSALARWKHEGVLWHVPELLRMKAELSIQRFDDG